MCKCIQVSHHRQNQGRGNDKYQATIVLVTAGFGVRLLPYIQYIIPTDVSPLKNSSSLYRKKNLTKTTKITLQLGMKQWCHLDQFISDFQTIQNMDIIHVRTQLLEGTSEVSLAHTCQGRQAEGPSRKKLPPTVNIYTHV